MLQKESRQLNALSRIAKYLDMKSKKLIFNSFIMSNLNYCPFLWIFFFCRQGNNKLQVRLLQTLLSDTRSDYECLFDTFGTTSLSNPDLKYMTLEALRSTGQAKECWMFIRYEMQWCKIIQPKMKTTTHGLQSFSYLRAELLNDLLKEIPDTCDLQKEFS